MPSYANAGLPSDPLGSGNPYRGSGFTNFDKYLQADNVQWGASQPGTTPPGDSFSGGQTFDNWMINVGHPQGFPEDIPLNDVIPPDNTPITIDRGPALNPIPAAPIPGAVPAPPDQQPPPSETNPTGGGVWTTHTNDPRVPGGYDKNWNTNDPRLPSGQRGKFPTTTAPTAQVQQASAFPSLDKKLQSGVW